MSWSKVKYFFFDTPEEKEAAQYSYEKEQTDMKKQQIPRTTRCSVCESATEAKCSEY